MPRRGLLKKILYYNSFFGLDDDEVNELEGCQQEARKTSKGLEMQYMAKVNEYGVGKGERLQCVNSSETLQHHEK